MSVDVIGIMRAQMRAAERAFGVAGCSPVTLAALQAQRIELGAIPATLSAQVHALEPQAIASLPDLNTLQVGAQAPSFARALAVDRALQASPIGLMANDLAGARFASARAQLEAARASLAIGDLPQAEQLAAQAHGELVGVTLDTYDRLRIATNEVAAEAFADAARALGFSATMGGDVHGVYSVWAARGDQQLAALVTEAGALEVDFQGYGGSDCLAVQSALFAELRARGWDVDVADAVHHGRRAGGALITEAARVARERACTPQEALLATASSAPTKAAGERERLRRALLAGQRARVAVR